MILWKVLIRVRVQLAKTLNPRHVIHNEQTAMLHSLSINHTTRLDLTLPSTKQLIVIVSQYRRAQQLRAFITVQR